GRRLFLARCEAGIRAQVRAHSPSSAARWKPSLVRWLATTKNARRSGRFSFKPEGSNSPPPPPWPRRRPRYHVHPLADRPQVDDVRRDVREAVVVAADAAVLVA